MPQTGELPRAAPILWALLRIFISAHLLFRVAEAEPSLLLLLLLLLLLYFLLPHLKQTKRRTVPASATANRLTAPFLHPALPILVPWTPTGARPTSFNVPTFQRQARHIPRKPHHSPSHHAVGGDNGERHT